MPGEGQRKGVIKKVEQCSHAGAAGMYRHKWWAMAGVGLGVLMGTLDVSIINISLPTLVRELNTNFATIQWVPVGYILVLTSLMLGAARLGDIIGPKKVYLAGLTFFTLGSLLCGAAPGVEWLIGFRAFQGLGAAMTQAVGVAIITVVFPPQERGKALGIIGGIVAIGLTMGPAMGGLIIGLAGWRWVFLVNIPVGLIAGFVTWKHIPSLRTGQAGQSFDVAGALLLLVTLVCYALAMTMGQHMGFAAPAVFGLLAAAVLGLFLFVFLETHVHQPMIDLTIFRDSLFSMNLLMCFLVFIMNGGVLIQPFFPGTGDGVFYGKGRSLHDGGACQHGPGLNLGRNTFGQTRLQSYLPAWASGPGWRLSGRQHPARRRFRTRLYTAHRPPWDRDGAVSSPQ